MEGALLPVCMSSATSTKVLPVAERKARVERLVASGKLSRKQAKLIDFREPTTRERKIGESLVQRGRRAVERIRTAKAA